MYAAKERLNILPNVGTYYTQLANCTDPAFSFKFENWVNYMDFTLDVKHTTYVHSFPFSSKSGFPSYLYSDYYVLTHGFRGNNPHSKRTKFAKAPINLDILQCSHAASGFSVCALKPGVVLELPVYDVQRE